LRRLRVPGSVTASAAAPRSAAAAATAVASLLVAVAPLLLVPIAATGAFVVDFLLFSLNHLRDVRHQSAQKLCGSEKFGLSCGREGNSELSLFALTGVVDLAIPVGIRLSHELVELLLGEGGIPRAEDRIVQFVSLDVAAVVFIQLLEARHQIVADSLRRLAHLTHQLGKFHKVHGTAGVLVVQFKQFFDLLFRLWSLAHHLCLKLKMWTNWRAVTGAGVLLALVAAGTSGLAVPLVLIGQAQPVPRGAGRAPPLYRVDLDQDPAARWAAVVADFKADTQQLIKAFLGSVPLELKYLADVVAADLDTHLPADYGAELLGISKTVNASLGDIVLLNLIYDVTAQPQPESSSSNQICPFCCSFCTGIIANDRNGGLWHGRNLDYGNTMPQTDMLEKVTIRVDFYRQRQVTTGVPQARTTRS
uniref:NAAA-beta domain-containing protein n=1 Tax=Macrostomum lignano TaxID=282301 RepID=A0A1I8IR37_9PLAT